MESSVPKGGPPAAPARLCRTPAARQSGQRRIPRRPGPTRQTERDAWRASAEQALAGLGAAIDRQFESWGLTPAEREVVLQLLKGRSHKEIAADTNRSERTVRQHAAVAYRKAGLAGRAELAAFFLEGVMLPQRSGSAGADESP